MINNSMYYTGMVRLANQNRGDFNYSLKGTVLNAACKMYVMNFGGKYMQQKYRIWHLTCHLWISNALVDLFTLKFTRKPGV